MLRVALPHACAQAPSPPRWAVCACSAATGCARWEAVGARLLLLLPPPAGLCAWCPAEPAPRGDVGPRAAAGGGEGGGGEREREREAAPQGGAEPEGELRRPAAGREGGRQAGTHGVASGGA